MNINIKTICSLITLLPMLFACSSGTDAFTDSSSSSSGGGGTGDSNSLTQNVGYASQKNLVFLFSDASPELWDKDGIPGTQQTITLTGQISDRNSFPMTTSQTIFFDAEWGTFPNGKTCVATPVTGSATQCSVTWLSGYPAEAPDDHRINFVIYTLGEETFNDQNTNAVFDAGDGFTLAAHDLEEPFIDCNHNYAWNVGDKPIDPNNATANGIHDLADGAWNGPGCLHPTLCSTTTQTYIWQIANIDASAEDPNPALTTLSSQCQ